MPTPKSREQELCEMFDSYSRRIISNLGKYVRRKHFTYINRFPASDPQTLAEIEGDSDAYPSHSFVVFADELHCQLNHELLYNAFNAMPVNQRKVLIPQILKNQGYIVDVSGDGAEGQDLAEAGIYDVIILDRMLLHREGVEILKHLRARNIVTPVIFLTAKDAISSRVEGLDAGADDYLVKPFSKDELLARVRALSRRSDSLRPGGQIQVGPLHLDVQRCEVTIHDEQTKLTPTETQLLELLMRNAGQVLTKEQILNRIWGFDQEVEIENVELYIFLSAEKDQFWKRWRDHKHDTGHWILPEGAVIC